MDALALIEPMVDTSRNGSHVWPKRTPKLGSSLQVFVRLILRKKCLRQSLNSLGPVVGKNLGHVGVGCVSR